MNFDMFFNNCFNFRSYKNLFVKLKILKIKLIFLRIEKCRNNIQYYVILCQK